MGLSAFGVPVLLQTVVPSLGRYTQMLQVRTAAVGLRPCRLRTALSPLLLWQIPPCARPRQMALAFGSLLRVSVCPVLCTKRKLLGVMLTHKVPMCCVPTAMPAARGGRCAGPRKPARPHGAYGAHAESTLQALPKDSEWLLRAPAAPDTLVHL